MHGRVMIRIVTIMPKKQTYSAKPKAGKNKVAEKSLADYGYRRTSLSFDQETYDLALENARRRGHQKSLSAYIAWLIEQDKDGAL